MSLTLRNVGEIILSNELTSIEWKVPDFSEVFSNNQKSCRVYSPHFQYRGISVSFKLTFSKRKRNGLSDHFMLTLCVPFPLSSPMFKSCIKIDDGFVYFSHLFGTVGFVHYFSVTKVNQYISRMNLNDDVIFTVEFYSEQGGSINGSCNLLKPFENMKKRSKGSTHALLQNLKDMYLNEVHCDVTIHVNEQEFKTHKSILSSRSTVFSAMFQNDMVEKNSNVVIVTDCESEIFHKFLLYLYTSKIESLSTENVFELYRVADKYDVDQLKADCIEYIKNNLSVSIFCNAIELAVTYDETEFLRLLKKYFLKHAKKIILTSSWKQFLRNNSVFANELFMLLVLNS